jgi:hypothetical protein
VDAPETLVRDRDYFFAKWRNGFIMVWMAEVTMTGLRAAEREGAKVVAEHADGNFSLSVTFAGAPIPSSEVRSYASRVVKQREKDVLVNVTVLEGKGLWAATSRLAVKALFALARMRNVVCGSVDEGAGHLVGVVRPAATESEIRAVLKEIRETARTTP